MVFASAHRQKFNIHSVLRQDITAIMGLIVISFSIVRLNSWAPNLIVFFRKCPKNKYVN